MKVSFVVSLILVGCSEPNLTPEDLAWSSEDLTAVVVLDARQALVVSRSGSIYRTSDAGQVFRRVYSGAAAALYDLSMFDSNNGWAVGDGRILVTRDGGRSWRVQTLPIGHEGAKLRGVHALGPDRAIIVGLAGIRLRTQNAGVEWIDRSNSLTVLSDTEPSSDEFDSNPDISFTADLHDVICIDGVVSRCLSFGAAGGVAVSVDDGETWVASGRVLGHPFEHIVMPESAVELTAEDIERINRWLKTLGDPSDYSIRVEVVASDDEIARMTRERDPEALFEILDARGLDVVGVIEDSGVAAERIRMRGAPPWGYVDLLDDDPELLDRYFSRRRAEKPGLYMKAVDERTMYSGVYWMDSVEEAGSGDSRVLGVGTDGAVWFSMNGGERWEASIAVGESNLLAAAHDGRRLIVVGEGGMNQGAMDSIGDWRNAASERSMGSESITAMSDIGFSEGSAFALIVGRRGLILRQVSDCERESEAGSGPAWTRVFAGKL